MDQQDHGSAPNPGADPVLAALLRMRARLSALIEAQRAESEAIERLRTTIGSQLARLQDRLDAMIAAPILPFRTGGARQ